MICIVFFSFAIPFCFSFHLFTEVSQTIVNINKMVVVLWFMNSEHVEKSIAPVKSIALT